MKPVDGPNAHLVGTPDGRRRLNTPALVLELGAFERNLAKMARLAAARGIALRPHAKTHKCVEIACRQIAAGAIGVSCTILREAEAMVQARIPGVLMTSPVATDAAIARLVGIARGAGPGGIMVVVDDATNAVALSQAAAALDHPLDVLVDFSSGYNRTGVPTPADALALARIMADLPNLRLRGLQAYAGNIQHIVERPARASRAQWLRDTIAQILAGWDGPPFEIVSGAGTGTHDLDGAPYTEMQPGSYLVGDAQYAPVLENGVEGMPFEMSLFLQTAVVSVQAEDYVTVDGGVKSLATDGPLPLVARGAPADCTYAFFGDEHGKILCPTQRPALGDRIELVTPHCDPTVNLHDALHVVDGDALVAIWPIDARGH